MARHSFIQMSKLGSVKGRISYISDPKRQENLYATYSTRVDMTFWNDLEKERQEEFRRFGTEGKCIEARELIIALPEEYAQFDPDQVLRELLGHADVSPTRSLDKRSETQSHDRSPSAVTLTWNDIRR